MTWSERIQKNCEKLRRRTREFRGTESEFTDVVQLATSNHQDVFRVYGTHRLRSSPFRNWSLLETDFLVRSLVEGNIIEWLTAIAREEVACFFSHTSGNLPVGFSYRRAARQLAAGTVRQEAADPTPNFCNLDAVSLQYIEKQVQFYFCFTRLKY